MSDIPEWQPGDLALCIKSGTVTRAGRIYTVSEVIPAGGRIGRVRWRMLCLRFAGMSYAYNRACGASRFRKVTPPKADEFDIEVIEIMTFGPREKVS